MITQFVNLSWQSFNYQYVRVRFPYGATLMWHKGKARNLWCVNVNVCPESFACQQTWRLGGEMRCDTRAHTRQVVAVVALMILRAYGSPGEMQLLVPDVDCKYPTVVYITQVGVWLSPSRPFMLFHLMCYSQSSWELPWFVALQSNSSGDYHPLFGAFWTVCVEQWEIVSDYLEATDNWWWYLSFVCSGPVDYKLWWATGFTITPTPGLMVEIETKGGLISSRYASLK